MILQVFGKTKILSLDIIIVLYIEKYMYDSNN